ncbi:hypothetical protein BCU17_13230 [Vibrio splendidus]|uniref:Uncharacterized protein n=1 Tax=Vibrio splendidus TaxID=29497 RepID=A0A2N7FJL5_VIBSP|nr:hypothetical protein [Vibrio splendidus]PMJ69494.1 hypothetical protein BCU17_13230 [Vibrio splendidus]
MQVQDEKHTKVVTKLYVEHACNFISTNQLAELLSVDPPRVSEMKSGRRRLSIAEGEIIQSEFGLPETSEGIYVEAELLGNDWKEIFLKNGETILCRNISQYANSSEFMVFLLDSFYIDCRIIEGYEHDLFQYSNDERKGREQKNKRMEKEKKLELINQLMTNSKFHGWYEDILQSRTPCSKNEKPLDREESRKLSDITHGIEEGFFINQDEMLPRIHFIVGTYKLIQQLATNDASGLGDTIVFGKSIASLVPNSPVAEYVINGRVVWHSGTVDYDGLIDVKNLFEPLMQHENLCFPSGRASPREVGRLKLTQENLNYFHFSIIYTEKHDYYLKVFLLTGSSPDSGDRTLLIKIQDRRNLFGELESIFEVLRPRWSIENSAIKAELAKNGAYIPSAIYLN